MNKCSLKIYKLLLVILILSLCVFFVACNIIDEIGNALSGATSSSSSEESSVESSTEESSEETENSEQSSTEEETDSEETPNYFVAKITSNATVNASPYIADAIVSDELSEQYLYLKDYMIAFEEALQKDDDSYLDYIDLDSFVRWLLVADYLCIVDGGGCNLFLYKEDSTDQTKVKMGPNWDFDSYMGDYNALATIRMHWSGAPFYYQYLIKKDSFQQRYKELFAETYQKLSTNIDNDFAKINENSFMELLEHENARFRTEIVSLSSRKQAFTSWLDSHLAWMETQFLD